MVYDVAVIGAGINGCAITHKLLQEGKSVALFDKDGIAQGGSGAAGAFISPKFSKAGALKHHIGEAFVFSLAYYTQHFSSSVTLAPLLHIAKDEKDDEILRVYKQSSQLKFLEVEEQFLHRLTHESQQREILSLEAAIVEPLGVCRAMVEGATFFQSEVVTLACNTQGEWCINDSLQAKKIVLATGAYKKVIDEEYIRLRGVWGHGIDIETTTRNPYSVHQFVSISPSKNNRLAIGATHNVNYHPQTTKEPYDVQEGRRELLEKASRTLKLDNIKILKDYTGLRSGSFDYLPLVGNVVDSHATLACCQKKLRVKKADFSNFVYHKNLYIINGSGGYGFVLAPYLAQILYGQIYNNQKIDETLDVARLFARWAKRV